MKDALLNKKQEYSPLLTTAVDSSMSINDAKMSNIETNSEQISPTSPLTDIGQTDYDRITVQRDHGVSRMTGIINTMEIFQADRMALQTRRDMLKECYKSYDQAQSTLEQWNPDESLSRVEVEINYINGLTAFERKIASKDSEDTNCNIASKDSVRLPTVDLPIFSGHGENWLEWFDKFNALIHRRNSLAVIQKFEYLKLSLRGAALGLIDSLPITEDNYKIAYEMIEQRYNNPKLLIQKHTRELFELKSLEFESATGLRNLFDAARKHLRCLENLSQPVSSWDALLIHLMSNKLDHESRRNWETVVSGSIPPQYKQLEKFVSERCQVLDAMPLKRKSTTDSNNNLLKKYKSEVKTFTITKPFGSQRCQVCFKSSHFIGSCNQYRAKSLDEKIKVIKRASLCYNCLRPGHNAEFCRSRGCLKCDHKHHTSIHREKQSTSIKNFHPSNRVENIIDGVNDHLNNTIIPTASIVVMTNNGSVVCRALIDSGSQSNFVTSSFIRRAGISTSQAYCQVAGFGQHSQTIREKAIISFKSRLSNYRKTIPALVTDKITGFLPSTDLNTDGWDMLGVNLADPGFHLSSAVDILLGSAVMFDILRDGNKEVGKSLPYMQNTTLGWIIGGTIAHINANVAVTRFMNGNTNNDVRADNSDEHSLCEKLFVETTCRTKDGKFSVRLPLKSKVAQLGDSKSLALDKYLQLEKRFEKDFLLKNEYTQFMSDYLKLGHMERLDDSCILMNGPIFYFPHHAVLRPESSTTKLRTVFNGSATTSSGMSLNDVMMTGPSLQQDIFNILVRFRCHRYVLTVDIKKMFRQIEVQEKDRQLQLILWRFSPEDKVDTYRLKTVTYGTCSAPFIAARCLKQLAIDFEHKYPEACRIIQKDFYMDDALTGHNQLEKLIEIKDQLIEIMSSAKFELHKWRSNEQSLADNENESEIGKILGLRWDTLLDRFSFSNEVNVQVGMTKRNILSEIQKIYDPLGILSPIIVHGKLVMQSIWSKKLQWDEPLPDQVSQEWKWFCNQIEELHSISFPRHVTNNGSPIELHGFSDASSRAYGAVIYTRSIVHENVHVSLLCAKSRIAPCAEKSENEDRTIPRLELRAATLLAELMAKAYQVLAYIYKQSRSENQFFVVIPKLESCTIEGKSSRFDLKGCFSKKINRNYDVVDRSKHFAYKKPYLGKNTNKYINNNYKPTDTNCKT
ncbi:uncharacterized protein LOC131429285 [Malaya genurostris]|uniref:uncharacterized protein LOC131429285 n=1 Tax=Malaya genurostris TaxID=325434 RepID=UPI0026F3883D|nr:uncharacterized protein LOC131429285 [Malaya genurostris]